MSSDSNFGQCRIARLGYPNPAFQERTVRFSPQSAQVFHYPLLWAQWRNIRIDLCFERNTPGLCSKYSVSINGFASSFMNFRYWILVSEKFSRVRVEVLKTCFLENVWCQYLLAIHFFPLLLWRRFAHLFNIFRTIQSSFPKVTLAETVRWYIAQPLITGFRVLIRSSCFQVFADLIYT